MDDYVKSVKEGLEESRKFFGNKNKPARELQGGIPLCLYLNQITTLSEM